MRKNDNIYKLDQFFTKEDVALKCINIVDGYYSLNKFSKIVEPSAGNGSFYYYLPKNKRIGIELDKCLCNKNDEYLNMSFFDYDIYNDNILVIGNPPFGTQNNLSVNFFNHAAKFADVIAFIIPKTWNKQSIENKLDLFFHRIVSIDLPKEPFYGNKKTNVKCCFQIWEKSSKIRKCNISEKNHPDWDFLPYIKTENDLLPPKNADFVILAYGANSGRISEDLYRWRPKSVHFIKSKIDKDKLINRFKSLDYNVANNSARQSSLGKSLLIELYKERFK
jgi:hypothetical protein